MTYLPLKARLVAPLKVQENGKEALRVTPKSARGISRLVPAWDWLSFSMFGCMDFKSWLLSPKVKGPSGFQVLLMSCSLLEIFEEVDGA